jgi:hypothetical protein
VPPGDPGAAPRPRGRPRLAPLPASDGGVDHGDGRVDKVHRRRRGRPSLTPAQLAARWLAARHRSTPPRNGKPDAEFVEAKMRARQHAADRRSADPGTARRPRGRPRKQPEVGAARGGPAPPLPVPPLRPPHQQQRRGRGGGVQEGAIPSTAPAPPRGRPQGPAKDAVSMGSSGSTPAPPLPPVRPPHQEQRRGRGGDAQEDASPSMASPPPLERVQGPTKDRRSLRALGPQEQGQGAGVGCSGSPPAPPLPPVHRRHQEQRRGRRGDVLEGASPSTAPAPPLGPGRQGPARGGVAAPLPHPCPPCDVNTRSSVVDVVEVPGRTPVPPRPLPHPWGGPRTLPGACG